MVNQHQDFLNMCFRLKKFYRNHEIFMDSVEGLHEMMVRFNQLTDRMAIEFEKALSYTNGYYSIISARKREELQNLCVQFGKAFRGILSNARYNNVQALKSTYFFDLEELNNMDEEALIAYASELYDLAISHESRLKTSGIYQKSIENLAKSLTLFALDFPSNKLHVEKRRMGALLMLKAREEIQEFLDHRLNPLMKSLADTYPEVYASYLSSLELKPVIPETEADFSGVVLSGGHVHQIGELRYSHSNELMLEVKGGNAIWGLGTHTGSIDYGRPQNEGICCFLKSDWIAPEGDKILIQAVDPESALEYRLWIRE